MDKEVSLNRKKIIKSKEEITTKKVSISIMHFSLIEFSNLYNNWSKTDNAVGFGSKCMKMDYVRHL